MTKPIFGFIDGPNVPPAIKPMSELHDKLLQGYMDEREIKVPKLLQSMQKRLSIQVNELCSLEGQIEDSNMKLSKTLNVLREVILTDEVPKNVCDSIISKMDLIHG